MTLRSVEPLRGSGGKMMLGGSEGEGQLLSRLGKTRPRNRDWWNWTQTYGVGCDLGEL